MITLSDCLGSHFLINSRPCRDGTRLLITPDLLTLWRESVSNAPSCGAWEGAFLRAPSGGALRLLPFRGPRGGGLQLPRASPPHLLHQGPWGGGLQPPPLRPPDPRHPSPEWPCFVGGVEDGLPAKRSFGPRAMPVVGGVSVRPGFRGWGILPSSCRCSLSHWSP